METPCLNEAHVHDVHVLSRISKTSPPVVSRCRSFSIGTSQVSFESEYNLNPSHLFWQQYAKHAFCDCNFRTYTIEKISLGDSLSGLGRVEQQLINRMQTTRRCI